jgi:hypothetical protein
MAAALVGMIPVTAHAQGVYSGEGALAYATALAVPSGASSGTVAWSTVDFIGCVVCNNDGQISVAMQDAGIDGDGTQWVLPAFQVQGPEGQFVTYIDPVPFDGNQRVYNIQWFTSDGSRTYGFPRTQWMQLTINNHIVPNHIAAGGPGGGAIHPDMNDSSGWFYAWGTGTVDGLAINMGQKLVQTYYNDLQLSGGTNFLNGSLSLYPTAFTNYGLVDITIDYCFPGC